MQKKVVKRSKRNSVVRFFFSTSDKNNVAPLRQDLVKIHRSSTCVPLVLLGIVNLGSPFQAQLVLDTHMSVVDAQTIAADTKIMVAELRSRTMKRLSRIIRRLLRTSIIGGAERYFHTIRLAIHQHQIAHHPPDTIKVSNTQYWGIHSYIGDELTEKIVGFAENLCPSLSSTQGGSGRHMWPVVFQPL
jgi:hypothetical protein